jgi:hypothetical protein
MIEKPYETIPDETADEETPEEALEAPTSLPHDHKFAPLIDIAQMDFEAFLADENANVRATFERIERDILSGEGALSAFQSFASDD